MSDAEADDEMELGGGNMPPEVRRLMHAGMGEALIRYIATFGVPAPATLPPTPYPTLEAGEWHIHPVPTGRLRDNHRARRLRAMGYWARQALSRARGDLSPPD